MLHIDGFEAHLADVNEILAGLPGPIGGYAMGVITFMAMQTGRWPPRAVIERASVCRDMAEVLAVARTVAGYIGYDFSRIIA